MPTELSQQKLDRMSANVQYFRSNYVDFFNELVELLKPVRGVYRFRTYCYMIMDKEYEVTKGTEDLAIFIEEKFEDLEKEYPKEYRQFANFLKRCGEDGYNNICRMVLGHTPDEVKNYGMYDLKEMRK